MIKVFCCENENRYAWADEGLVAYGKAFSFSRHQKFCESAASLARSDGWPDGEPVLSPSEFRVCRH